LEATGGVAPPNKGFAVLGLLLGYVAFLNSLVFLEVVLDRWFFASIQIHAFSSFLFFPPGIIKTSISAAMSISNNHSIFPKFSVDYKYYSKTIS
jgi:hypothetical protein